MSSSTDSAPLATMASMIREHRLERAVRPLRPVQINVDEQHLKDLFDIAYQERLIEYRKKMARTLAGGKDGDEENEEEQQQPKNQHDDTSSTILGRSPSARQCDSVSRANATVHTNTNDDDDNDGAVAVGDELEDDFHVERENPTTVPLNIFGKVLALPTEVLSAVPVAGSQSRSNSRQQHHQYSSVARVVVSAQPSGSRARAPSSVGSVGRSISETPRREVEEEDEVEQPQQRESEQRTPSVNALIDAVFAPPVQHHHQQQSGSRRRGSSVVAVHVPEQCVVTEVEKAEVEEEKEHHDEDIVVVVVPEQQQQQPANDAAPPCFEEFEDIVIEEDDDDDGDVKEEEEPPQQHHGEEAPAVAHEKPALPLHPATKPIEAENSSSNIKKQGAGSTARSSASSAMWSSRNNSRTASPAPAHNVINSNEDDDDADTPRLQQANSTNDSRSESPAAFMHDEEGVGVAGRSGSQFSNSSAGQSFVGFRREQQQQPAIVASQRSPSPSELALC